MPDIQTFFNINTVFITVLQYQMSYIEFFGTVFTIWCVWLTTKAKIISWPVGLIGSVLYVFLFYQIQLYSDLFEQIYFIVTGFVGWFMWLRNKKEINTADETVLVGVNSVTENVRYVTLVVMGTGALSYITMHLSGWFPMYFPEPVAFPILDAGTTVMSFVAQWLLMRKKIESWVLWVLVDAIDIGLYWSKGVKFISLEYMVFFFMATYGLVHWVGMFKNLNNKICLRHIRVYIKEVWSSVSSIRRIVGTNT